MFCFDTRVGYLYPDSIGDGDQRLWLNSGSTYEGNVMPRKDVCVLKHGLRIPLDARSHSDFVARMKQSEREFADVFRE